MLGAFFLFSEGYCAAEIRRRLVKTLGKDTLRENSM